MQLTLLEVPDVPKHKERKVKFLGVDRGIYKPSNGSDLIALFSYRIGLGRIKQGEYILGWKHAWLWSNPKFPQDAPRYITREVQAQIIAFYDADKLKVYECDREGNQRFENLRYFEPDMLTYAIQDIRNELEGVR